MDVGFAAVQPIVEQPAASTAIRKTAGELRLWQDVVGLRAGGTMMRTIEIPLPDELLRLIDEKAQITGLERDAYIRAVLSKDVTGESFIRRDSCIFPRSSDRQRD